MPKRWLALKIILIGVTNYRLKLATSEVPNLYEPADTFRILTQCGRCNNIKMAATGGGANHKITGSKTMHDSYNV